MARTPVFATLLLLHYPYQMPEYPPERTLCISVQQATANAHDMLILIKKPAAIGKLGSWVTQTQQPGSESVPEDQRCQNAGSGGSIDVQGRELED